MTETGIYLVRDRVDFYCDISLLHHLHNLRMFIQGVAVPDTARVQQDGVDQIVVGWRPFPICNRVQMMLNHA